MICICSKSILSFSILPVNRVPCKIRVMVWQTKKNDGFSAVIGVWGWKYDFPGTPISHEVNHGLKGYSVSCEWRFAFTRSSHSSSQSASGCSGVPVLTGSACEGCSSF